MTKTLRRSQRRIRRHPSAPLHSPDEGPAINQMTGKTLDGPMMAKMGAMQQAATNVVTSSKLHVIHRCGEC
eukprot:scaffold154702_cov27-Tisochrysis_lutea.AAC.2